MPDDLAVFSFAPAIEVVGCTIGKISNRLYTVLSEGDKHSRCYAWNILKPVFNPKLLWIRIRTRLYAL